MEEYTLGFPPEMNNKKYRKAIDEKEEFMTIPLEGKFRSNRRKDKNDEITH
jgi:hypothetical protein